MSSEMPHHEIQIGGEIVWVTGDHLKGYVLVREVVTKDGVLNVLKQNARDLKEVLEIAKENPNYAKIKVVLHGVLQKEN